MVDSIYSDRFFALLNTRDAGLKDDFHMKQTKNICFILCQFLSMLPLCARATLSANQLCNLGHDAIRTEQFDKALHYYEQAQRIYLNQYDSVAPEIALTEAFIGYTNYRQGKMTEAQQHYLHTLQILSRIPGGNQHPLFLNTINNLATVLLDLGNYHMALRQYNRLNQLTVSDTSSLFHFTLQSNIATAQYLLNNTSAADSIWGTTLTKLPNTTEFIELRRHISTNMAHCAIEHKNYERADSCITLAASTFQAVHRNTLSYSYIMDLQAYIDQQMGNFASAEKRMKQVVEIRRRTLGENHADYILALNNLANLYAIQNNYELANNIYKKEFSVRSQHVATNLLSMSERQQMLYVEKMDLVFETYLNYAFRTYKNNPIATELAYDDVLFYKGLLLNTANVLNEIILNSTDSVMVSIYQQLVQAKRQLMNSSSTLTEQEHRRCIARIDSIESVFSKYSQKYHNWDQLMQIRHQDIQQKLSSKTAAIEFADFPLPDGDRQYIALLLNKDSIYPTLIPLCKQSDLCIITNNRSVNRLYDYNLDGARLSQLIWEPLSVHLSETDTIYYALSGILHLVNFGAIPIEEDQYVADKHVLIQTSSTRHILTNYINSSITNAAVFGGIRYNDSVYADNKNKFLPFLRNTLESTFQLQNILEAGGLQTTTYTEYAATKDSLCALSGTPLHILHIATHGFYIPDDSTLNMSPLRRRLVRCSQLPGLGLTDNMKRSGLLMAGASAITTDSTTEAFSRSVLTARDVSMLNLSSIDMVVLSACETAKGDVSSDGVFGLQRAFKQAGVRTIVMTLWKVNDFVTRDMMLTFYRYWTESKSKRDAFQQAIIDMRNRYPEPEYWAAYVMLD